MADLPAVLLDADLCEVLRIKLTTLKTLRRQKALPIPELPKLDKRHRYGRRDVEAYLAREGSVQLLRRRA